MIHRASIHELGAVEVLHHKMFSEGRLPGRFDSFRWHLRWKAAVEGGHGAIFIPRPFVDGFLSAILTVDWNTSQPIAVVMNGYVHPKARHKGLGTQLLEAFEKWARDEGCSHLLQAFVVSPESEAWGGTLKKRGWAKCDDCYRKELI